MFIQRQLQYGVYFLSDLTVVRQLQPKYRIVPSMRIIPLFTIQIIKQTAKLERN